MDEVLKLREELATLRQINDKLKTQVSELITEKEEMEDRHRIEIEK